MVDICSETSWTLSDLIEEVGMPFLEVSAMDERLEFVRLASAAGANVRQLCRRFGISPTTGYKWLARAAGGGELRQLSRRPRGSPRQVSAAVEAAVIAVRQAHPAWGGRKIRARLERQGIPSEPMAAVPAASTVTAILRRNGEAVGELIGREPLRRFEHAAPNDLWQMDFKGHVGLGDGRRLHPLTVLDDHSRYAIVLRACADQTTATVRAALVDAFRHHGLPTAIITDNGSPWGDGPGHPWTPLGVFLIEQGIRIGHSRPYHPQTMGKDERFHRSLKAEVLARPSPTLLPPTAASPTGAMSTTASDRTRRSPWRSRPSATVRAGATMSRPCRPSTTPPTTSSAPFSKAAASASAAASSASPRPSAATKSPSAQPAATAATTSTSAPTSSP
jgi:transposase InsO family protein